MSIGGIGTSQATNPLLASLFARLDNTSASASPTEPDDTAFTPDSASQPCNALSGSPTAQVSDMVLGVLVGMQQMSDGSSSTATTTSSGSSPLDQVFSAMDTNGDGTVSQSEMETYLEQQGATQGQADAMYASLDQSGSNGISESQMQSALQQGGQVHHGGGHHHHHGVSGSSSGSAADALEQAMDSNGNGSVDETEFSDFLTQNGGTAAEAEQDFTDLNTSGSGALSTADFASAIQQYQSNMSNGPSPMLSLIDTLAQNAGSTQAVA
ncbi:MAG TPA: EF-hand domain-containing protein [Gemmataceae bacterium]|nr:EF-hand domain-containing protein [Gemmataceae bacterium]